MLLREPHLGYPLIGLVSGRTGGNVMATDERDGSQLSAEQQYRAAAGAVFRRLRAEHRWSLREFGERVGVAHTSLYAVEREETSPSTDTLAGVAAAVELTLAGLLALIVDEMTGEPGDGSLAAAVVDLRTLSASQRRELIGFAEYLRFRDRSVEAR